jgi:hypothetical protein
LSSDLTQQPLNLRCLALTGAFETSFPPPGCFTTLTGDFDGQGLSYSALQWNLGQGTLQPLLVEMNTRHPDLMLRLFGDAHSQLSKMLSQPRPQQLAWARSVQNATHKVEERWTGCFRDLGRTSQFQTIAMHQASALYDAALGLCRNLGLHSQRGAALMFDIKVQNGGINSTALAAIQREIAALPAGDPDVIEAARMRSAANRVADSANPRWREDVRSRKLVVANGTGVVHGVHYDLAAQFALTMSPWQGA